MASIGRRLTSAWNAFQDAFSARNELTTQSFFGGGAVSVAPGRQRPRVSNERTILASIFVRMSIDLASIDFRHARVGENEEFVEIYPSALDNCLYLDANLDQSARAFKQDLGMTLFERGYLAVVPVDTTADPRVTGSYDIETLRVGHVTNWTPLRVEVNLYNEEKGERQNIWVDKSYCAIIENPFFDVMNEYNSTLQRLIRKLSLLDAIDEQIGSSKLDLIIQLPYSIKTDARRNQAEIRRKDIEDQLSGGKYGIAYTDGTEKITQLNRPVENTLVSQVADLKTQVYQELGMTPEVLAGTADEQTMLNYFNASITPIAQAIREEFTRKFLTKTARTQKQRILAMRSPFKFVPVNQIAEIADKFTRNEILSSNEIRAVIGFYPSKDPKADELRNSNIAAPAELDEKALPKQIEKPATKTPEEDSQNGT